MALDSQGKIFLLNVEKSFVLVYGPDGQYQSRWGGEGGQPENFFLAPDGIAVDGHDNVFVTVTNDVKVFDASGHYLTRFRGPNGVGQIAVNDNNELYATGYDQRIYRFTISIGR